MLLHIVVGVLMSNQLPYLYALSHNAHYFCLISKYIINVIPINVNSVMAAVLL